MVITPMVFIINAMIAVMRRVKIKFLMQLLSGMKMLQFNLPYPPSINNYYRKWNNTIVISPQGKLYRQLIWSTLWVDSYKQKKWDRKSLVGDLGVEIMVFPPDKRKRDLDNIKKALFDALQHAGLYKDDYQICDDHTVRMQPVKNGLIELKIKEIRGD